MPRRRNRKNSTTEYAVYTAIALVIGTSFLSSHHAALTASLATLLILAIPVCLFVFMRTKPNLRSFSNYFKNQLDPVKQITLNEIDAMSGVEFEKYIGELFRAQGFKIEYTKASTDYGVDLVLEKDHIRTAVQIKRYSKPLTQAPIREVVAGMMQYRCSKGMVVTNSTFTKSALILATSNYVKLIDRSALTKLLF